MNVYECNGRNISSGEICYCSIQWGKAKLNRTLLLSPNEISVPLHKWENICVASWRLK